MTLLQTRITLDDLILKMMQTLPSTLQLEQLQDWVARLDLRDDLLNSHIRFCCETYQRKLLCRTSRFDLLVLCWQPGQFSSIHDHGDSLNVTRVYRGQLTSRVFQACSSADSAGIRLLQQNHLGQGELASVDRHQIHQLANVSNHPLVTLHVYARPLLDITVYCPNSGKTEQLPIHYQFGEAVAQKREAS